ncbi:sugar transferase [Patescibacteria group bacterium]|nr:sugar transferase [Patescibacteria group bacterium]MBU1895468.1 sugar transferase [Patescibacteria group bacterium]
MKRSEIFLMMLQVPIDFVMLVLAAISAYYLRFTDWAVGIRPVIFEITLSDFLDRVWLVMLGWLFIFAFAGLYSTNPNRKMSSDLSRVFLACTTALGAIALYVMFTQQLFDSRFLVAAGWGFAIVYVILGRLIIRGVKGFLYRIGFGLRRVVVIGSESLAEVIIDTLNKRKELGYKVVGKFKEFNTETIGKIKKLKVDEMIFTNPRADENETLQALDFCNESNVVFKYSADVFSTYSANMSVSPLAGVPIVELKRTRLDGWGRVIKRLFDIVLSLVVIIITCPITIISGLFILIETGRPIIYKNERVGIRGRKFFTLKFRSMYKKDSTGVQFGLSGKKAEEREKELIKEKGTKTGPVYKIKDDPRVTPFGRFIRRWSIDELPQFFNVLGGSMSIVGPRPHQPREVEKYEKHHRKVLTLKPGITGLAQISGRSDLNFEDEVRLDVLYIEKWSLLTDLIVFIKTPFILFKKRKAL